MQKLAAAFVPAAQDLITLQAGTSPDALFFRAAAKQGHYKDGGPYGTMQGAYAITPSGILLGSTTLRGAEDVAGVLKAALEKWQKLPRAKRLRADDAPDPSKASHKRDARPYPEDGLVLDLYARDLPDFTTGPDAHKQPWNQDHVWFDAAEAKGFVPQKREVGATSDVPRALLERVAMLDFIDVVNGLRWGDRPIYEPEDDVQVAMTSTVESIDGDVLKLKFEGHTHTAMHRDPVARGVDTQLLGHATFDVKRGRFTAFALVALGKRWGSNWVGDRDDRAADRKPAPIGYSLSLAGSAAIDHVPPEYLELY